MVNKKITYKKSGVNIDEGNLFVKKIQPFVKKTLSKNVLGNTTSFAALYKLNTKNIKNPVLVSCTDGVGTKVQLGVATDKISGLGIDLVAMCVNDLICTGGKPLFFLDYIATSKLSSTYHSRIVKGISKGCLDANCSIVGGETAEMPGMYSSKEFDIAGFCTGIVDYQNMIDINKVKKGNLIIGLPSSGPHSNGYSLIRKLYSPKELKRKNNKVLLESLMKPTRIYVNLIDKIYNKKSGILGIANITGGGLIENIPRSVNKDYGIKIFKDNWKIPKVFNDIMKRSGLSFEEMSRVFNMGIGMAIIIDKKKLLEISKKLGKLNERFFVIGEVVKEKGFEII